MLSSTELLNIFKDLLIDDPIFKIEGEWSNPCHFTYAQREFYAYIKNLSPAYFSNKDVWRAQMTNNPELTKIKASEATFLLMGYDEENKVYATWNPYKTKQRIDTAASPSFYSRLSIQKKVSALKNSFQKETLNNGLEVFVFTPDFLTEYLTHIDKFFLDKSDYVAIGSKRRASANEAYRLFSNVKNYDLFVENTFTRPKVIDTELFNKQLKEVRLWIKEYVPKYKTIFLKYDHVIDYTKVVDEFLRIVCNDPSSTDVFLKKSFLHQYIRDLYDKPEGYEYGNAEDKASEQKASQDSTGMDWETQYTSGGKLTRIANPDLIELLRPDIETDYPRLLSALNKIESFYGNRFPKMELSDWTKLIKSIDWNYNRVDIVAEPDFNPKNTNNDEEGAGNQNDKNASHKRRKFSLDDGPYETARRFVFSIVKRIMKEWRDVTYDEMRELLPEKSSNNAIIVTEDEWQHYNSDAKRRYFSSPEDVLIDSKGKRFLVSNQWGYDSLRKYIFPFLKDMGYEWKMSYGEDSKDYQYTIPKNITSRRKIRVQLPTGVIINYKNVTKTFIETMRYIVSEYGPDNVRQVGIKRLKHNLVTKNVEPPYQARTIDVGQGYFVCINTSTNAKYEDLWTLKDKLNIEDMIIELI